MMKMLVDMQITVSYIIYNIPFVMVGFACQPTTKRAGKVLAKNADQKDYCNCWNFMYYDDDQCGANKLRFCSCCVKRVASTHDGRVVKSKE